MSYENISARRIIGAVLIVIGVFVGGLFSPLVIFAPKFLPTAMILLLGGLAVSALGLLVISEAEKQPMLNRVIQAAILTICGASLLTVVFLALLALQHFTGWGVTVEKRW